MGDLETDSNVQDSDVSKINNLNLDSPGDEKQDASLKDKIEYEKARADAFKEERQRDKQKERSETRSRARGLFSKIKHPKRVIVIALVCVVVAGIGIHVYRQYQNDSTPEPVITTTADLESVMNISYLSTLEYDYHGIAEHHKQTKVFDYVVKDEVDYRVKYKATFTVSYDLTEIKFKKSEGEDGEKLITAYLPDPQISKPAVSPSTSDMGYLPDTISVDISEIYDLCEQDALEADTKEMTDEAVSGLKDTVQALTTPLMTDDTGTYQLKFDSLANYVPEEAENEA